MIAGDSILKMSRPSGKSKVGLKLLLGPHQRTNYF
jgi:hypothetical protein